MSTNAPIAADLDGQVIRLWSVVYNNDRDCVYTFFSWRQVLNGVEGSLRVYLDECQESDILISTLIGSMQEWHERPVIPLCVDRGNYQMTIDVYRWEIDRSTALFRILSRCYEQVDDATKLEIMTLLSNRQ